MKLDELLRGTRLVRTQDGNILAQTIRNMQVLFLTCEPEHSFDNDFANPLEVIKCANQHYGQMQLQNTAQQQVIVAPQIAVMTPYAAQNHAMTKSAYIPPRHTNVYEDAGCVQGSQAGYIRGTGGEQIRFVPVSIREMLLNEANKTGSFSHLYPAVTALGNKTNTRTGNYIDVYYNQRKNELDEFIAHFERPANTIGTIVLIDGEIVAIDKFPSFKYTAQVWDLLVRDCYGSLAIESMLKNSSQLNDFEKTLALTTQLTDESPVDYLKRVMELTNTNRDRELQNRIMELMTVDFKTERDQNSDPVYNSEILKSEGYIGQVIHTDQYVHLVSLIKKDRFDPTKLRAVSEATNKYRQAASEQRQFSL